LVVSGGHASLFHCRGPIDTELLGGTIDDACGEAFDKIAKFYNLGYPGGVAIDRLAQRGNSDACSFPMPSLHKGNHRYDVSYSGLKTAAANQLNQFWNRAYEKTPENIAAAFQKAAIDILLSRLELAIDDTGIRRVVAGGGVAANSYLRRCLSERKDLTVAFPSLALCTDNGAMIAGIGHFYLARGDRSPLEMTVSARVPRFKRGYP